MTNETHPKNLSRIANATADRLSARAVPALTATVNLLQSGDADASLAQLSVLHSQVDQISHRIAGELIRETLRRRFPTAVALELVLMGRVVSELRFVPRAVLDQDGGVLWAYELLRPQERSDEREWENVLAQYCDCLLAGDHLPAGTPATDPAIAI